MREFLGAALERLLFPGSITWLETSPSGAPDLAPRHTHRTALTNAPAPLVAASRSGVNCAGIRTTCGPEELLGAWSAR